MVAAEIGLHGGGGGGSSNLGLKKDSPPANPPSGNARAAARSHPRAGGDAAVRPHPCKEMLTTVEEEAVEALWMDAHFHD